MNISTNNTVFSGRQEILYGLKKAANCAKSLELCTNAYSTSRMAMTKYEERMAYNASMRAYLDMIFNDSEFITSVNSFKTKDLNKIRTILKEECNQHGTINPLKVMKEHFADFIKSQKTTSPEKINAAEKLFSMLV